MRLLVQEEFKFCGEPKGRDKELIDCMAGLRSALNVNEGIIYEDDATLSLASTGLLKGPNAIAEHVSLVSFGTAAAENSLVYNSCYLKDHFGVIVNSVSSGFCDVTTAAILTGNLNESYVSKNKMGMEAVVGFRFNYTVGNSSSPLRVNKMHTFWVNPFVNTFVPFDQEKTSDVVCNVLENVCAGDFFTPFQNHSECVDAMNTLPIGQWDVHGYWHYEGNSTGCRAIQSILAARNPNEHCPHLSWNPLVDPNGNYKCNDMVLGRSYYNWTTNELDLFKQMAAERKIVETALARFTPVDQREQCEEHPGSSLFEATLKDWDKFEDVNIQCYHYLQEFDATPDRMTTYWCSLFGLMVGMRMIAAYSLHRSSSTSN